MTLYGKVSDNSLSTPPCSVAKSGLFALHTLQREDVLFRDLSVHKRKRSQCTKTRSEWLDEGWGRSIVLHLRTCLQAGMNILYCRPRNPFFIRCALIQGTAPAAGSVWELRERRHCPNFGLFGEVFSEKRRPWGNQPETKSGESQATPSVWSQYEYYSL